MSTLQTATPSAAALDSNKTDESIAVVANQWQLIWWKFRKHKLAMLGGSVTFVIYFVALFADFFAPFPPNAYASNYTYAPPQQLHILDQTEDGLRLQPYVNGYKVEIDYNAGRRNFVVDPEVKIPVGFFVEGEPYKILGLIDANIHLIGPLHADDPMYLLGADRLGQDVFSRTIYGARISMTIGLVGVAMSLVFGVLLGGISGYFGGWVDELVQYHYTTLASIPYLLLMLAISLYGLKLKREGKPK